MKILAVGCLHGKLHKRILNAMKRKDIDLILIAGDFGGGNFQGQVREYERKIVDIYGVMGELWPREVRKEYLKKVRIWQNKSAENSRRIFKQLKKLKKTVYYVHGNWDSISGMRHTFESSGDFLIDKVKGRNLKFIHDKVVKLNGYYLIGFAGYRGTAMKDYLRDDIKGFKPSFQYIRKSERTQRKKLDKLFKKVKNKSKVILLTHDPPYNTLDYLKPRKKHYGEKITRDAIKEYKSLLCVCAHFHENQGKAKIGKTTIVNIGYGHDGKMALIELNGKVKIKIIR